MEKYFVYLCVVFGVVLASPIHEEKHIVDKCGYESCHPVKDGYVNVHIVPHTHDDVGWLKTVDQYYYGSKPYIQKAGVRYILDSVVESLSKDPNRRFIYVETSYFWKWWMKQHDFVKHKVKKFVRNGQLEFIGGAWSMNDEATTHYQSIIDQFTWGLRILNETFGDCGRPKVGWQIDPFGHSREMASIFAQLGFDGLLLGRIDYQDKKYRFKTKNPEGVWLSSRNLGHQSKLFTSVLYNTYNPPSGFCFDILCEDEPIIDDKKSTEYNVDKKLTQFLQYIQNQRNVYMTDNLLITMGGDFTYMDAEIWYKNLDKLISHVKNMSDTYQTSNILITMGEDFHYQDAEMWFTNLDKLILHANQYQFDDTKYNLIYSTPSCYLKAVHDESEHKNIKWPVKVDDFFPYASDKNSYWTGYFTSRPTLKRFEREGNNFLQVCKQLYALTDLGPEDWADLNVLREAMGIMQHHDAITGTEKEHVAYDYARILTRGMEECEFAANAALSKIMLGGNKNNVNDPIPEIPIVTCPLMNITECNVTENLNSFIVTVYNPLSRPVTQHIRLPVTGTAYVVKDPKGNTLSIQLIPIPNAFLNIPGRNSTARVELIFRANDIPPLGYKSYYITKSKENHVLISVNFHERHEFKDIGFKVDKHTGLLSEISMNEVQIPISQEFFYYRGAVGNNNVPNNRSSGAYIFRPNGTNPYKLTEKAEIKLYKGPLLIELHQNFNKWISQVIRIYSSENLIEFDWLVGPIPIDDINGKEIISRFKTDLKTDSTFYTDSNGRELIKRVRNFRPTWKLNVNEPVAGNYYPVTSKILIRDSTKNIEIAVLTDRAQGGSSLHDGEIELMVHRNCLHDDAFGVGEALNESAFNKGVVVRGSHFLIIGPYMNTSLGGKSLAAKERDVAQRKILQTWTFFSPTNGLSFDEYKNKHKMEYAGLKYALPDNVQILTLEPWHGKSFLLRLEHVLEIGEDPILSKPATINMKDLFVPFKIKSLSETTLGANQWLNTNERLSFTTGEDLTNVVKRDIQKLINSTGFNDSHIMKWLEGHERYHENLRGKNDVEKNDYEYIIDNSKQSLHRNRNFSITLNPMQIRTFIIEIEKNM